MSASWAASIRVPAPVPERLPQVARWGSACLCAALLHARTCARWPEVLGSGPHAYAKGSEEMSHPRVVNVRAPGAKWDIYVGRGPCPRTGELGRFGNPFPVKVHGRSAMALFLDRIAQENIPALRVRFAPPIVVACWCAPRPCHGEVYARLGDGEELAAIRADILPRIEEPKATLDLFKEPRKEFQVPYDERRDH